MTARQGSRVRRGSAPGLLRDAAREVFAENGYRATTREIAERAGVSHDLIFRYFESKEKLLFDAVVTPLLDAVDHLYRNWREDPALSNLSKDELVEYFTGEFYDFVAENQSIARAMTHLFTEGSTGGELDRMRERIASTLESIVPSDASAGLRIRVMMLSVGGAATFLPNTYRTDDDVPSRDEVVAELARFIHPDSAARWPGR